MTAAVVGSGIDSQLLGQVEGTYGVAADLSTPTSWEFKSETLEAKKTTVQGEGLHAGGMYMRSRRRVLTNWDVNGGVVMDLPTKNLNMLLKMMLGSGDTSVYADNGTLAAIDASTGYRAVHIPGVMQGQSWTLQKGVPTTAGTVEPFTYVGCKCSEWEISVTTGEIAQLSMTFDARNELGGAGNSDPLNASPPDLADWTDPQTNLFHFREATLATGASVTTTDNVSSGSFSSDSLGQVKSISIKQTTGYDTSRYFLGSKGFKDEQIENALRAISGSFVIEWDSEAQYEAFAADTATSLLLTFVGTTLVESGYYEELDILIPAIKLDGESPKVPGPAVITQTVNFTGLDDETNNPIQFTYTTSDTGDTDADL
jgi:Phage tail tube protein